MNNPDTFTAEYDEDGTSVFVVEYICNVVCYVLIDPDEYTGPSDCTLLVIL
jgi:hypothetical protein